MDRAEHLKEGSTDRHPIRDLLADYDDEVEVALTSVLQSRTGIGRVRAMHNGVRQSLVVHDSVLRAVLCPLLESLPGGQATSERLKQGCEHRAALLNRFDALTRHVAAEDVYPVAGAEVEQIIEELITSFDEHVEDETAKVIDLFESTGTAVDPVLLEATMSAEAREAPTRRHASVDRHPNSGARKFVYRVLDRLDDWGDTHRNWSDPDQILGSPRSYLVNVLKTQARSDDVSADSVLTAFDRAVAGFIAEFVGARTAERRSVAAHRLDGAIAIHDSVVNGVLVPLLRATPEGERLATELQHASEERMYQQRAWLALVSEVGLKEVFVRRRKPAEELMRQRIDAFRRHERQGSTRVAEFLTGLPPAAYRTARSPLDDVLWIWRSEGAGLLAFRMALWAESAPTRNHPATMKHPESRLIRSFYHLADGLADHWGDTWLERWFVPRHEQRPFEGLTTRPRA